MQEIDPNFFINLPKCYQKKTHNVVKKLQESYQNTQKSSKKRYPPPKKTIPCTQIYISWETGRSFPGSRRSVGVHQGVPQDVK